MPKKLDNGEYQCSIPGCGYTNLKEGWVRNHEINKHSKGGKTETKSIEKDGPAQPGNCPECGRKVRLLNPNNKYEKAAIAAGYKKICVECEEIIK